ncbi:MAG: energy transducer TonB [Muribaculaceae bacterium]|jgi:protein TonB|nr:energy transducer TonB [Muribaculaceae bacterium]
MAKDVDLTSREWREIVFEGKNKEFGAYKIREASPARHTKAVVSVLVAVGIILVLLILSISGVFAKPEEDTVAVSTVQELVTMETEEEIEEEIEEETFQLPEPEEIVAPEEVANQQQVTALLIVEDEQLEEDKQVKNQDEVLDNEAAVGAVDITEGTNDLNKVMVKEEVIAEPKVEEEQPMSIAMVEQKPQFAGGEAAMYKWLSDNIVYPPAAAEEGVSGRVVVEFVVGKDGSISNVRVVRSRHTALDKEALRVVKAMPNWIPGRNNGQPVKVTYTLPVTFKLQ